MIHGMIDAAKKSRQSKVTAETQEESRKLKALWEQRATLRQAEFGERYEIGNQSAVTQFLNGKVPLSLKAARGFAQGLGVDIASFSARLADEAAKNAAFAVVDSPFATVRRAAVTLSQGHGRVAYDEGEKAPLSFRREFLRRLGMSEQSALVVGSAGPSNEPDIPDGAVLLVHTAQGAHPTFRPGKFYAFRLDGDLFVKKIYHEKDGSLRAVSANPDKAAYPDMLISERTDDFEPIGRVVWMGAEL